MHGDISCDVTCITTEDTESTEKKSLRPLSSLWFKNNLYDSQSIVDELHRIVIEGNLGNVPSIIHDDMLNRIKVALFFNDNRKEKIENLRDNIAKMYLDTLPCKIKYSSENFEDLFQKYMPLMCEQNSANFLFLDQNGVKHITKEIFKKIINIPTTDFLFFISSSTFNRFNDNSEIKKYISMPSSDISSSRYNHIHRLVLEYYKSLIPEDKEYYLSAFSIKKGANIYGLIFGTGHLRGIDKFVTQCWKIDPLTGDSNYDIDQDNINISQPSLFPELDKPRKVQGFELELENAILNRKLITNKEIYKYALFNGFKAAHARSVISKLIKDGKLPQQKIYISYSSCASGAATRQICYGEKHEH